MSEKIIKECQVCKKMFEPCSTCHQFSGWRAVVCCPEHYAFHIPIISYIRNKITKGDKIEILSPYQFEPEIITIDSLIDGFDDKPADFVGPGRTGQTAIIPIDPQKAKLFPELTIIRMKI